MKSSVVLLKGMTPEEFRKKICDHCGARHCQDGGECFLDRIEELKGFEADIGEDGNYGGLRKDDRGGL